mmetsp:Transcript_5506/g.9331  ORF Transcript_5506/g.9331 Transcript_5506/m.9331 type:complete len:368 (+) Transcript_5506:62-1165(+)
MLASSPGVTISTASSFFWHWRFNISISITLMIFIAYMVTPRVTPHVSGPVAPKTTSGPLSSVDPLPTPELPLPTPRPKLSREFVRDMALLAEHLMMHDLFPGTFEINSKSPPDVRAAKLALSLTCREVPPRWAPDKYGDLEMRPDGNPGIACEVRRRRALGAVGFQERWRPVVVEWIDSGHGLEKQCAVLLLWPSAGGEENRLKSPPLIVVAFRGSKTHQDYFVTDISPRFIPVCGPHSYDADWGSAMLMPRLADNEKPCASKGAWRAYAGEQGRETLGPRARVRRQLARLMKEYPNSEVILTGHSLGGALCTLCAYDLLHSVGENGEPPLCERATLLPFAAPRMFNRAFQRAMQAMQASGKLRGMR